MLGALLLGSPSSLRAQTRDTLPDFIKNDPNWIYMDAGTAGVTYCVPGGVRTVYNDQMFRSDFDRIATQAHEHVHQIQLRDRSLCHPTASQLLQLEAEAYCYADAALAIHSFGMPVDSVSMLVLSSLEMEFVGAIAPSAVKQVWLHECSGVLGLPPRVEPDGTTVRP